MELGTPTIRRYGDLRVEIHDDAAAAVRAALEGPVDPACPASALRRVPHATAYLDAASASRLSPG